MREVVTPGHTRGHCIHLRQVMEPVRFVEKSRFSSIPSIERFSLCSSFMDFIFGGRFAGFHFAEHFCSHHGIKKILFFIWIFLATWLLFPAYHFGGAGTIVYHSSKLVDRAPSFSYSYSWTRAGCMFDDRQLNQNYRSSFPCIGQGSNILLPDKGRRIREDEGDFGNDRFIFDIVGFGGANIFSSGQHSSLVGPSNHSIFFLDVVVDTYNSARAVSEVESAFGFFLQLDFRNFSMKRAPFCTCSRMGPMHDF